VPLSGLQTELNSKDICKQVQITENEPRHEVSCTVSLHYKLLHHTLKQHTKQAEVEICLLRANRQTKRDKLTFNVPSTYFGQAGSLQMATGEVNVKSKLGFVVR
jgi:hypothetical protein